MSIVPFRCRAGEINDDGELGIINKWLFSRVKKHGRACPAGSCPGVGIDCLFNQWCTKTMTKSETIDGIKCFHRIGSQSLDELPRDAEDLSHLLAMQARAEGISVEYLRRARRFATEYPQPRKITDVITEEFRGSTFGLSHLFLLMRVPIDKRISCLRASLRGRWTLRRLEDQILVHGTRPRAGRKPRIPARLDMAYVRIEALCEKVRRLHARLREPKEREKRIGWDDLATGVRTQLAAAVKATETLQRALSDELSKNHKAGKRRYALDDDAANESGASARKKPSRRQQNRQ